jgi:hypothetical protein
MGEGHNRWRTARFNSAESRAEFIDHARAIPVDGIEIEPLEDELRLRFRAPARLEIGLAGMVEAHDGKILPSCEPVEVRTAVNSR